MKKRLIIGGIVVVMIGGGFFAYLSTQEEESPYAFVNVERGDLQERVLTTATVEAANEFALSFTSGGRVASVDVTVGSIVLAGQELARLDTATLEAIVRQQRAARDTAQADLNKVLAGATPAVIAVAERGIDATQTALNIAQTNLVDARRTADEDLNEAYDDMIEVFRDVELSAEGAIQTLNTYMNIICNYQCLRDWGIFLSASSYRSLIESAKITADAALDRIQTTAAVSLMSTSQSTMDTYASNLMDDLDLVLEALNIAHEGFQENVDKTVFQTARLDVTAKRTALDNQEQAIARVKSANTTNITVKESAVRNAEAALASARAELDRILEPPRTVDIASLKAGISRARANLDAAVTNLENTLLKAPVGGTITQVSIQAGEIAATTSIAIGMVSGATYSVEANVPEADIAKIALGDPVDILIDALPGQDFTGSVVLIDPAEQIIGGVVTFKVTTDIKDGVSQLKPGMTADLDILTAQALDALFVPQRAVLRDEGMRYIRILVNGEEERLSVTTGIRSAGGMVEITSGLTKGQEIINFEK